MVDCRTVFVMFTVRPTGLRVACRVRVALAACVIAAVPATAVGQGQPVGPGPTVVSGRVVTESANTPIPFVTVIIERGPANEQVTGTLAGEDGRFVVRGLAPGTYRVRFYMSGFQPADTDVVISPLNRNYDLGDVRLPRMTGVEENVTVVAEGARAAALDSQVFRLGTGPAQSTGTVLDALRSLPGVTVDQDGQVSLRGSNQVSIVIDGRQSSLTGFGSQRSLDSVSAANIEAIEIIHNPSARFDAAGMAGIINIIYKQEQRRGWSGDVGLGAGVGQVTRQRPDLPTELGSYTNNGKFLPSVNASYRSNTWRTFMQGELLLQDDLPNNEFNTRFYDDGRIIESQVPENREQYHYTVRGGVDWMPNGSNTLTVSGIHDFENHVDRAQVPFILANTGVLQRYWFWREQEDTGFSNATLEYTRQFSTPGRQVRFNVQFTRGLEDEAYFLNEVSPVRVGTDMTHLIAAENTLPVSVDYTRPIHSGRLEVGGKVQWRWIPVNYTVERGQQSVIYEGLGDESEWAEDILAAYANLVHIRPRYTLEGGLRLEQTGVRYRLSPKNIYYPGDDAYDYFELFPNAKFSVQAGARGRLHAAFNRRIDRPGEPELRVFPKYDDPELLKVGNPYLRPQLTNVVETGYTHSWSWGSASAAVYHRDIRDAFLRIYAIDDSNPSYDIVNRLYENAGDSRQTGVQVYLDRQVTRPWRLSVGGNVFRNTVDAFSTTLLFPTVRPFSLAASRDASWDATFNNRVQLPAAVDLQVNYIFYAGRNVPQGRERARSSFDVSATVPVQQDRIELVLSVSDLFNDFGLVREVDGIGVRTVYENLLETQVAMATVRLKFCYGKTGEFSLAFLEGGGHRPPPCVLTWSSDRPSGNDDESL